MKMHSGYEGSLGVEKGPRQHPRSQELDALVQWLVDRGVNRKNARKCIIKSGCDSLHSMAVYLRFQLPPLHLANVESVDLEMHGLLGVRGRKALNIITDLDVPNCVNVDINQEAATHLFNTGLLSSIPIANTMDQSPSPSGRNVQLSYSGRILQHQSSIRSHHQHTSPGSTPQHTPRKHAPPPPARTLRTSFGHPSTPNRMNSQRNVADMHVPVPTDLAGPSEKISQHSKHQRMPLIAGDETNNRLFESLSRQTAGDTYIDVKGPAGVRMANTMHNPAYSSAENSPVPNYMSSPVHAAAANAPQIRGQHASQRPWGESGRPSGRPNRSPKHEQMSTRRRGAIAEGIEATLPDEYMASMISELEEVAGPMAVKSPTGFTGTLQTGSMGMGGASEPIASDRLPGVPTISRTIDPGAYNQANAMLRGQLPHYHATATVKVHWDHICVWLLQIVSLVMYIGIRGWYLLSGKTAALGQEGVNIPYSWMVLAAEVGLGLSGVYLRQNFWKQTTSFREVPAQELQKITRAVAHSGIKQTVHVLITTYTEPAVTVRECVLRCLVAPEPIYMEKMVYVCDDGHAKSEGPKKRAMVEELRILGHTNVFYVGDRIKKPGQLNGKSANLNHVLLHKIYPTVRNAEEVPMKDIFMVMDCDHMVKPDIFNRMGPCMLDEHVAVCLVPQCFHNLIYPDALDAANGDFMFGRLPFFFGAGVLFVTGTNVMVRSRAAFEVCKFADANAEATVDGEDHRQLFTVDEISEDVVLGSRLHAAGFKGVFIAQNLATGEVPLEARAMWRQRFRWFKGGHLFLLSPTSVFFDKTRHMSFYQKSLYWICLVANVLSILADPILLALPPLCLMLNVCVYGLDQLLFWTHLTHTIVVQFAAMYYSEWSRIIDALKAHVASRVLWFTTVKACINTVMVLSGWKKSGVFKATPKLGENPADTAQSARLPDTAKSGSETTSGTDSDPKAAKNGFKLHLVHDGLSKVTEVRKYCLPFDGTLDFWVIMGITAIAIVSVAVGVRNLWLADSLRTFDIDTESLKWLAIAWALHEAMPGMVFAGYVASWDVFPKFMKFWLPFVSLGVAVSILFVEIRVAIAFVQQFYEDR